VIAPGFLRHSRGYTVTGLDDDLYTTHQDVEQDRRDVADTGEGDQDANHAPITAQPKLKGSGEAPRFDSVAPGSTGLRPEIAISRLEFLRSGSS
jgi:hypothetical protein